MMRGAGWKERLIRDLLAFSFITLFNLTRSAAKTRGLRAGQEANRLLPRRRRSRRRRL